MATIAFQGILYHYYITKVSITVTKYALTRTKKIKFNTNVKHTFCAPTEPPCKISNSFMATLPGSSQSSFHKICLASRLAPCEAVLSPRVDSLFRALVTWLTCISAAIVSPRNRVGETKRFNCSARQARN